MPNPKVKIKRPGTIADHAKEFWSMVKKGSRKECWLWSGGRISAGYGEFKLGGKDRYAHRLALELHLGRSISGWVLHSCDQPTCCNPEHLYEGKPKDNSRDMWSRGRSNFQRRPWTRPSGKNHNFSRFPKRGEAHSMAKLRSGDVRAIREASRSGMNGRAISKFWRISPSQVSRILKRQSWQFVD